MELGLEQDVAPHESGRHALLRVFGQPLDRLCNVEDLGSRIPQGAPHQVGKVVSSAMHARRRSGHRHAHPRLLANRPSGNPAVIGALLESAARLARRHDGGIASVVVHRRKTQMHDLIVGIGDDAHVHAASIERRLDERRMPGREERYDHKRFAHHASLPFCRFPVFRDCWAAIIERMRMRVEARSTISSIFRAVSAFPPASSSSRALSTVTASSPHPNE